MIRIVSGTCGVNLIIDKEKDLKHFKRVTAKDGDVTLDPEEESRLVGRGVAVYAGGEPDGRSRHGKKPDYSPNMGRDALEKLMGEAGLAVKRKMTKQKMVDALDAHYGGAATGGVVDTAGAGGGTATEAGGGPAAKPHADTGGTPGSDAGPVDADGLEDGDDGTEGIDGVEDGDGTEGIDDGEPPPHLGAEGPLA